MLGIESQQHEADKHSDKDSEEDVKEKSEIEAHNRKRQEVVNPNTKHNRNDAQPEREQDIGLRRL